MSDIGGGPGFGEVNIGGSMNFQPRGRPNLFQRAAFGRQGITGNVSASLKFDIPGLKDFRTELDTIRKSLESLDKTFGKIVKAPAEYAKALADANKQLKEMKANAGATGGGLGGEAAGIPGTEGIITPSGKRSGGAKGILSGIGKWANVFGRGAGPEVAGAEAAGAAEGGAAAAGLGGAAAAGPVGAAVAVGAGLQQAVGQTVSEAVKMMFERFDRGMATATAADVFASRRALAIGTPAPEQWRQQMKQGFGFYGTMEEINQSLYQAGSWGAFQGGQGVGGQRGAAFQQSIGVMQQISPGMTAGQATSLEQQRFSNVQGMKQGYARYGPAALPYTAGGKAKTQQEYFRDIMRVLERLPWRNGKRGAWSKEQLEAQRYPGSSINAHLAAMGLSDELIEAFWEWAIANAAVMAAGQGPLSTETKEAQRQLETVTGGSAANRAQQLETREARRDTQFGAQQYGTIKTRLENEARIVDALTTGDGWLAKIFNVLGGAPSGAQGMISGALGGIFGGPMGIARGVLGNIPGVGGVLKSIPVVGGLFGDPGYIGDAESGLSHLTPDLRERVSRMMGDNPQLMVNSAYRDNLRQQRLFAKGGPFAPSGQSKHGRGQAVDLGPATQHAWLATNASKYGIDMAGHMGEPWHAQLAGTMGFMGDPPSVRAREEEQRQRESLAAYRTMVTISQSSTAATASGGTGGTSSAAPDAGPWTGGQTGATTPSGGIGTGELTTVNNYAGAGTQAIKGTPLSMSDLVKISYNAGFRGEDIVKIAAISMRESGGGAYRYAYVPKTHDKSYGLWMQNAWGKMAEELLGFVKASGGSKLEDLYDPQISANATYQQFKRYGWRPWGPYKNVSELHNVKPSWLDAARAAAKQAGYLGDVDYSNGEALAQARMTAQSYNNGGGSTGTATGSTFSLRSSPVVFNNTFNVRLGSGSRIEVDAATRQIAARLEVQVARVVSRKS